MNTDQARERAAQPADEELKKHGDQLKKQVEAAAREKQPRDSEQPKDAEGGKD